MGKLPVVLLLLGGSIEYWWTYCHIHSYSVSVPSRFRITTVQCWTAGAGDPIFLTTLFIAWHAGRWRAPAHNDMLLKSS